MRFIFLFFTLINTFFNLSVCSAAQVLQTKFSFEINGHLKPETIKGKAYIFLSYDNDHNQKVVDSALIINNEFKFNGNISDPRPAMISNGSSFRMDGVSTEIIYICPDKMDLTLSLYNFKSLDLKGSFAQSEHLEYVESKKAIIDILEADYIKRGELRTKNANENDPERKIKIEEQIHLLQKKIDFNTQAEVSKEFEFILTHLSSYVVPDILIYRLMFNDNQLLLSRVKDVLYKLDDSIKNSTRGKKLIETVNNMSQNNIGQYAKDFEVIDINGNKVLLSDFLNKKNIIIDFWASWCMPCREETPKMIKIANKYQEIGLEIIAISQDRNATLWKKAIEKDKTSSWLHILSLENFINLSDQFSVTAIPVKIFINKKGIIEGIWRGGGEDNLKQLENILEKNRYK